MGNHCCPPNRFRQELEMIPSFEAGPKLDSNCAIKWSSHYCDTYKEA